MNVAVLVAAIALWGACSLVTLLLVGYFGGLAPDSFRVVLTATGVILAGLAWAAWAVCVWTLR